MRMYVCVCVCVHSLLPTHSVYRIISLSLDFEISHLVVFLTLSLALPLLAAHALNESWSLCLSLMLSLSFISS